MVDTRSGIREDKLILDIAALEEGSRYARLQFLNPDGKVLKSIDIWQSTDFTIKFELISLDEREIRVNRFLLIRMFGTIWGLPPLRISIGMRIGINSSRI